MGYILRKLKIFYPFTKTFQINIQKNTKIDRFSSANQSLQLYCSTFISKLNCVIQISFKRNHFLCVPSQGHITTEVTRLEVRFDCFCGTRSKFRSYAKHSQFWLVCYFQLPTSSYPIISIYTVTFRGSHELFQNVPCGPDVSDIF